MRANAMVMAAAVVAALAAAGCGGSLHDVQTSHASGRGTVRVYASPPAEAYAAAIAALRDEHADDPLEEHAPELYVLGTRSASVVPWRYGAFVGVWVSPSGEGSSVAVVTRRTSATAAIGVTESGLQDAIAARLAAAKTK